MLHYQLTDFSTPAFNQNPTPIWEQLRTTEPCYRMALPGGAHAWMITHYDDVLTILKDPRFIMDIRKIVPDLQQMYPQLVSETGRVMMQQMMNVLRPSY